MLDILQILNIIGPTRSRAYCHERRRFGDQCLDANGQSDFDHVKYQNVSTIAPIYIDICIYIYPLAMCRRVHRSTSIYIYIYIYVYFKGYMMKTVNSCAMTFDRSPVYSRVYILSRPPAKPKACQILQCSIVFSSIFVLLSPTTKIATCPSF